MAKKRTELRKFVKNVDQIEGISRKRTQLANDDELDKALSLMVQRTACTRSSFIRYHHKRDDKNRGKKVKVL